MYPIILSFARLAIVLEQTRKYRYRLFGTYVHESIKVWLATAALLLSFAAHSHAQWRTPLLTELGAAEGLPMVVNGMCEDFIGYRYFYGSLGLVRYDGVEFELMSHDPDDPTSIGPGEIWNAIVGRDSLIWLALRHDGLNMYDPVKREFHRYPIPQLPYPTRPETQGLLEDGDEYIWVGAYHFQLLRFNKKTEEFTSYQPDWIDPATHGRRLRIWSIIQDTSDDDLLWLSVLDLSHTDDNHGRIQPTISFRKSTGEFKLHVNNGRIMAQTPSGLLYSTNLVNHISKFDPHTEQYELLDASMDDKREYMTRAMALHDNSIWVTNRFALMRFDSTGKKEIIFRLGNPLQSKLASIDFDGNGDLWLGNDEGVVVLEKARQYMRFFSLSQFDDYKRIYPGRLAYFPEEDKVYLSSLNSVSENRLYRIPLNSAEDADYLEIPGRVRGLTYASGKVFAVMDDRLHTVEENILQPYNADGFDEFRVPWNWNLRVSKSGWVIGAGTRQLFWFRPGEIGVRSIDLITDLDIPDFGTHKIEGFKVDQSGSKVHFISSEVYELDLESGKSKRLKYAADFNPMRLGLADVQQDHEGFIWLSGPEYVAKFKQSGDSLIMIDRYLPKNGLTAGEAHEFHLDEASRLWIFTVSGISCIDTRSGDIRAFSVEEGLQQIYIDPRKVIEGADGSIITPNANGILIFQPDSLWYSSSPGEVRTIIKEVRLNGEALAFNEDPNVLTNLSLPPFRGTIDISFQGLEFPTAQKLRYSYRLNSDESWINIGHNTLVTLPALDPGNYEFQVKASIATGNAPVRTLAISIAAPFYKQWWFILLCFGILAVLIWTVYSNRIKSIRRAEKEKADYNQRIAELELKALRSQMNPHFMFNSLNSIKNYILQAEPKIAAEYLSNFSHLIRMILQNSGSKVISLKEELDTLLLYIDLEKLRFDDEFEFNCIVDENINLASVHIPPMILQPYIENAIWHGLMHKKSGGQLTIELKKADDRIECIIEDDGVGREAAARFKDKSIRKYRSMGMGITKDRIDIINRMDALGITTDVEDLADDDGNPAGTRVILSIPSELKDDFI